MTRLLLFANTGWYLYHYRRDLIRTLLEQGWDVIAASPDDEYVESLKSLGIPWYPVQMTRRGLNPLTEIESYRACYRVFKELRPTLVHLFTLKSVLYGTLAARRLHIPGIINSITGLGYLYSQGSALGRIPQYTLEALLRRAFHDDSVHVIFQNPDDCEYFDTKGILNPGQASVIHSSGVSLTQFPYVHEPSGIPVVLIAARMLWDKGIDTAVKAAEILKERGIPHKLVLAGSPDDGNPASIPEKTLQMWNEKENIKWLGHVDEIEKEFAESTVVILPSSYREGVPRSLIEAAATGRPLIASDMPGCREIVHENRNGFLIPINDPLELANMLDRLLTDEALRYKMGIESRRIVEDQFSSKFVNNATIDVYRSILEKRGMID